MNLLLNRRLAMDWNQITQAIQGLSKDVSGKVKETADVLKLRQKASVEKQRIRDAYEEIGRLYFKECEGKEVAPEYQEFFDTIAEASAAVAEFKSKIEELRNTKTCPECGAEMYKEAASCAKWKSRSARRPRKQRAKRPRKQSVRLKRLMPKQHVNARRRRKPKPSMSAAVKRKKNNVERFLTA